MKIRSVLVVTVGLLVAPALRADEVKADLEALRGTWEVVSQQRAGRPTERPRDMKWVIDGETVWLVIEKGEPEGKRPPEKLGVPGRGLRMTCRLDSGKSPTQIDLDGPKKSSSYGIYKLAGDELTVCMGVNCPSPSYDPQARPAEDAASTRPATFSPEAGTVIVLRRVRE
jgi:uncharacterized protein (TIGR03067 family)